MYVIYYKFYCGFEFAVVYWTSIYYNLNENVWMVPGTFEQEV